MTALTDIDLERILNDPQYALDFQYFIGDVEDFLDYSESNIEWQYRVELQRIRRETATGDWPGGYPRHLEQNAEHRFKVSLPLRVRYAAVIALVTSVEWSINYLATQLKVPISKTPKGRNDTVHALFELQIRTGTNAANTITIGDYEALVHLRNCIAHCAGIEEHYKYREQLTASVCRLNGVSIDNWRFLGKHICISKGALNPYIRQIGDLIVAIHKAVYEQGLLQTGT